MELFWQIASWINLAASIIIVSAFFGIIITLYRKEGR